ncbi:MAG: hypothetical protein JSW28_00305, partial [Thermoplasmata archaeon]
SGLLTVDHPDPVDEVDTDSDGTPDNVDTDDDNDGLLDVEEDLDGDGTLDTGETDPLDPDTDGDGVDDSQDEFPRDPVRWQVEPEEEEESSIPLVLIIVIVSVILVAVIIAAWVATSRKKGGIPGSAINCPSCGRGFQPDTAALPYVQCPFCGTSGRIQ